MGVNRAGTVTITLSTAEVRSGRTYTIKDESGGAASNNITVATESSETIDGSATDTISDNYGSKTYYSDGINWFTVPLLAAPSIAHSATTGQGTGATITLKATRPLRHPQAPQAMPNWPPKPRPPPAPTPPE